MATKFHRGFTLIELIVVVGLLALAIAILLPSLNKARSRASRISGDSRPLDMQGNYIQAPPADTPAQASSLPLARVSALDAQIELTPRLSVGTADAESIYEAKFTGRIRANGLLGQPTENQIFFPLPPQIISLADLTFTVDGVPSDAVTLRQGKLVWQGKLPAEPTPIELTYTAVGKGVYALEIPTGAKLETFKIDLTSVGSDVRMLELSLQPTRLERISGKTLYKWDYKNLAFGRPIALDVLGIAPIDRLGELTWLGPLSIVMFGLLIGLIARAYEVQNFDRWMLLLIIGTFTGAYPLMYFAQEYTLPLVAIGISAAIVILIIAVRAITIMGWRLGLLGAALPAAATMTLALAGALQPRLQGILLTIGGMGFFIVAMSLAPRLKFLPATARKFSQRFNVPPMPPTMPDSPSPAI